METKQNVRDLTPEELQGMIENANANGLLMCMTDAEVNDIPEEQE